MNLETLKRIESGVASIIADCQQMNTDLEQHCIASNEQSAQVQEFSAGIQEVQTAFERNNTQIKQLLQSAEGLRVAQEARHS